MQSIVKSVVFRNDQNSFTVLTLEDEQGCSFRASGVLGPVKAGDSVTLEGQWKDHPQYGRFFDISAYQGFCETGPASFGVKFIF